jgi:pimeloyl-ACP methyl ester carboxylesterase
MTQPHLLLLPGLVCDADVWTHQSHRFSAIATVHVADYGMSDSLAEMARVALDSVAGRFALAGHSMGGRVAFEIVRRAPERVLGLAVLDTGYEPVLSGEAGEREKAERLAFVDVARSQGMRAMARQWLRDIVHPSRLSDEPLVESIVEMMGRKTPAIFAAQVKALLDRPDATPVLRAVRCPAIVLCGREDAWSPISRHRDMAALIPQSKLIVVENCGHMATMERPDEVTSAMLDWFEAAIRESPPVAGRYPEVDANSRT